MTMKGANFLEKLLDNQPVEWKKLGEVCDIKTGKGVTKKDAVEDGVYPIISGGKTPMDYIDKYNRDANTVTVSRVGANAGYVNYLGEKFYLNDKCFSVIPRIDYIHSKFLYYILKVREQQITAMQSLGGVPTINTSKVGSIEIPLPPLSVQSRIVEILDKFTSLEAELEAELELRKKQYAYYREQLLNFSYTPPSEFNVVYKKLGEVCELVTDFTAAGSFASNAKNVKYLNNPDFALLVRTTDLKQKFQNEDRFIYVDKKAYEYLWRVKLDVESIIMPNVGNCGEVYFVSPELLPYSHCVLGPNALLIRSNIANQKFLFYLFHSADFQAKLSKITSSTGQTKFNKTNLKQLPIPLPPLSEQERIVEILDKFDTLTNSISEGLPLEIQLRRQQYEYYREQLLAFPHS